LTHSSIRNIIEWSFGILKARWQILDGVPHCHKEKQKMIMLSCFALHNYLFIRHHGLGAATYRLDDWVALNADSTMRSFGWNYKPAEKHCWLIFYERKILFRLKKQAE
jgi:hypothetical protein